MRYLYLVVPLWVMQSHKEVLALVQSSVANWGVTKAITSVWWESLPNLTIHNPAPLSQARVAASDSDVISRYFNILEQSLAENNLEDKPCQIFNMDETGMPLEPKSVRAIFVKGEEESFVGFCSGNKSQITVVACVSVAW